jgi:EAL domain-containing protein (putative c-di-GMP-specific phosphodiesterase class I)
LKIDKSFIDGLGEDTLNDAIVRLIVNSTGATYSLQTVIRRVPRSTPTKQLPAKLRSSSTAIAARIR